MNISINQQNFTGSIKRGDALRNAFRTMPKEILEEFTTLEKNAIKTNDNKVLDFFEKQVIKNIINPTILVNVYQCNYKFLRTIRHAVCMLCH